MGCFGGNKDTLNAESDAAVASKSRKRPVVNIEILYLLSNRFSRRSNNDSSSLAFFHRLCKLFQF